MVADQTSPSDKEVEARRMSWKGALAAMFVPMGIQLLCFAIVSANDPCNGNPGCMAGTLSSFVLVLVLAPSFVVLLLVTLVEALSRRISVRAAIIVNSILAALPFIIIFGVMLIQY